MGREGVGNNGGNLGFTPGGLKEGEGAKMIELGGGSGVGFMGDHSTDEMDLWDGRCRDKVVVL